MIIILLYYNNYLNGGRGMSKKPVMLMMTRWDLV